MLSSRWQKRSVSLCVEPTRWPWCPVEMGRWVRPSCRERCWTSWPASPRWWRNWPESPSHRWIIYVCSFCLVDFLLWHTSCQMPHPAPFPPHFLFCRWLKQIEETLDNSGDQADLLSDRFLCHLSSLHESANINSLFYLFQPLSHIICITAPPSPHVTVSTSCCDIVKKLLTLLLLLCSNGYSYNCSSIYPNLVHIFACSVFLL